MIPTAASTTTAQITQIASLPFGLRFAGEVAAESDAFGPSSFTTGPLTPGSFTEFGGLSLWCVSVVSISPIFLIKPVAYPTLYRGGRRGGSCCHEPARRR